MHAAKTRLLYDNANTGIVVTILIACLLGYAQWDAIPHLTVANGHDDVEIPSDDRILPESGIRQSGSD